MSERSDAVLHSLEEIEWYFAVGQPLDDEEIIQVGSWKEAIDSLTTYAADRLFVPPTNQLRYLLREKAPVAFQQWNQIANSIRPLILHLVERKTNGVLADSQQTKLVIDHISWDVMHACMESEYEEACTIHYHRQRVMLLRKGHCPCGWQGEYPQGKHLVY